jgi:hypothetical protein
MHRRRLSRTGQGFTLRPYGKRRARALSPLAPTRMSVKAFTRINTMYVHTHRHLVAHSPQPPQCLCWKDDLACLEVPPRHQKCTTTLEMLRTSHRPHNQSSIEPASLSKKRCGSADLTFDPNARKHKAINISGSP